MNAGIIQPLSSSSRSPSDSSGKSTVWLPLSLSWPGLLTALIFAAAFSLAFGLGSRFPSISPFWLPDSVLLCALLLFPRSTWWFFLLAALPLRLLWPLPGLPLWLILAAYANDSIKALLSAGLIQRFIGPRLRFDTMQQFFRYSLIAVIVVPLLSAIAGASGRLATGDPFSRSFRAWFLGDVLAALVCTPMLLCSVGIDWRRLPALPRRRLLEAACLIVGAALSGYLALIGNAHQTPFLLYLPLPFLLWAATRFGPFGAACSLTVISALGIFGIFRGQGPFAEVPLSSALQSLQLFMIVISFPLLALATAIKQQHARAAAVRESEERLHQFSARLIDSQEWERKFIGQRLHEEMAQRVAALSIGLSSLSQSSGISETLAAEASQLRRHASEIVYDLSQLSRQLRPPILETAGLSLALQVLCEQVNRHPDVSVTYEQTGQPVVLPWEVAVSLYRVVQESLDNALAHSCANLVSVGLFCENGSCEIRVCDNGSGFDLDSAAVLGFGIAGMKERMRSVGGTLMIDTIPGSGTEIIATIPSSSPRLFAAIASG